MAILSRWVLAALIVLLALFTALVLADDARAEPLSCGPVDQVVEALTGEYHEVLVGTGAGPNGTRLLVFAHPDGTTWTVLGLLPDGKACFIASGTDWKAAPPTPPGSET